MTKSKLRSLPISYRYLVVVALLLCVILFLESYVTSQMYPKKNFNLQISLMYPFSNFLTWLILVKPVYSNLHHNPLTKANSLSIKTRHILFALGIIVLHNLISNVIFYSYFSTTKYCNLHETPYTPDAFQVLWVPFFKMVGRSVPSALISRFLEYAIIIAVFIAIDLNREFHRKKLQLATMETELSEARLRALRMQLRPHFLFNALNSVSSLMDENVETAQTVLARLGNLLRKTLKNTDQSMIDLKGELEFIRNYLDIEQIRFHDRLHIDYNTPTETLTAMVPGLILQPLVENAMKHGFDGITGQYTIQIIASLQKDRLTLSVIDNGKGVENVDHILKNPGVGIKNTLSRLQNLYPDNHEIIVESSPGKGFEFTMIIPYLTNYSSTNHDN